MYQANPVVSCGDEEDGAILYNPDTDTSSVINLSGRELWSFLNSPRTVAQMIEHLCQSYSNVPQEQAERDVERFIQTLIPNFLQESTDES